VKTGRLLKLEREGVSIQVYFYREDGAMQASVFVLEQGRSPAAEPLARFRGESDPELERTVRAFVDLRWPRRG
jgi:hypothetical protein